MAVVSQQTLAELRALLGEKGVRSDDYALQAYALDRSTQWQACASAVLFPETNEQVQQVIRTANARQWPLVPSGGRTGLSGGAVARHGELVLSLERMNRILNFNAVDQLVTVQAGLVTQKLQEYATQQGLYYPVDFASAGSSQIGGNIATNAGGIKVIRYGMTRDWVRGLKVVTGNGDMLDLNGGLIKNNTGYDFRHLMIGSEGSLGVICEATMALARAPGDPVVLVLGVPGFPDLLAVLSAFRQQLQLSAFECFSDLGLRKVIAEQGLSAPFDSAAPYYALVEFEQEEAAQATAMEVFESLLQQGKVTDGVISQSLGEAQRLWALRECLSETLSRWKPYKNDISVAVSQLPHFLAEADALVSARYPDFEVVWYGHIGDGNLHLNILKPDDWSVEDFTGRCSRVSEEISALVQAHGGSISAEHGVGLLKKPYLHYSRSPAELVLMQQLKGVFDPAGLLNPGKLI